MAKVAAGVAAVGGIAATSAAQSADAPYYEVERAIHAEVNRRRESWGLAPLAYNPDVAAAARAYSRRMAAEGFFSHTPPDADSFAAHYRDDGVDCRRLGENILYRTRRAESPEAVAENVVDQWMASAGHRDNIMGDWRSEGVGVAVTGDGVLYATQGFASCPGTADASEDGGNASTRTPDGTETPSGTDTPSSTDTPNESTATPTRTRTRTRTTEAPDPSAEAPSATTETPSGGGDDGGADDGGTAETVTETDDANASDGGWDDSWGDDDHRRYDADDDRNGWWRDEKRDDERRHRGDRDVAVRKWQWDRDWGWNADRDDHDRHGERRGDW